MMNEMKYTLNEINSEYELLIDNESNGVYFRSRIEDVDVFDLDDQLLIETSLKRIFNYDNFDIYLAKNLNVILPNAIKVNDCMVYYRSINVFFHYMAEILTKSAVKQLLKYCYDPYKFYCSFMKVFKCKFLLYRNLEQLDCYREKQKEEEALYHTDFYDCLYDIRERDYTFIY